MTCKILVYPGIVPSSLIFIALVLALIVMGAPPTYTITSLTQTALKLEWCGRLHDPIYTRTKIAFHGIYIYIQELLLASVWNYITFPKSDSLPLYLEVHGLLMTRKL